MGWTNSVPIFHDDVTHILQPEIPDTTVPYIDDVPIRGPEGRYPLPDGTEERISDNPGIRRFVWEHFQNLNRVSSTAAEHLAVRSQSSAPKRSSQSDTAVRHRDGYPTPSTLIRLSSGALAKTSRKCRHS